MSDGPTPEEIHDAVDRTVAELLADAGIDAPPVDPACLARHLGLKPDAPPSRRGKAGVVANREDGPAPRAWLLAHAIGQHRRAHILRRLDLDPEGPGPAGGSLPNLFADRLLVPTRWLAALGREHDWDLLALEERFHPAGHELVAWRMLDLADPVAITVIDNGQVTRRRGNAFRLPKTLSEAERRCQETVHRFSRPHELRADGWRVQGWPIHQPDWKREILRSRFEED